MLLLILVFGVIQILDIGLEIASCDEAHKVRWFVDDDVEIVYSLSCSGYYIKRRAANFFLFFLRLEVLLGDCQRRKDSSKLIHAPISVGREA